MKISRMITGFAGAGLLTTAALLGAPEAAAADHSVRTNDGDPGGVVYFTEHGDVVQVCDIEADGWAVGVDVYWNGGEYTLKVGGNGNCRSTDASEHDIPENAYVNFRIYLYRSGTPYAYQDTAQWYNDH
ncbi:hypothetical protein [Amycolatopsis thermophila]|uniref:Secreted protein n=1 Tax=Amycolatopsis thermophila TaxID=206084 RepID=A0ABU0F0T4_9PSEU|nr:hypothetical protein [Amycolatopsis thermophila]MDQ0381183.1 hypothetical protein [Amycolatopsis thermophila]